MTHVDSFKEYVDDLEQFVTKEVSPRVKASRLTEEHSSGEHSSADSSSANDSFVYVANSMAGAEE